MKVAYVDSSCLVAIAFGEPGARTLASRLRRFDRLLSSNLLEAELRSALVREGVQGDVTTLLSYISWIYPDRALTREFKRILSLGYLKGADLWHLACALFVSPEKERIVFLTLDSRQEKAASRLGLAT